ncbi:MAG TPA: 3'(2'),5'-bisphosphate nucleotidase CysQ [Stellaceae bacterium]|jgi:3'(2'), 5'-bisphosphate nucleotidase|nr:3'(2'),5'-bisphosphate nucleotidase CysQ [Stellaceae bacterium]
MSDKLLDVAIRAALAAGDEIMRVYASPFDVIQKGDNTPLTEADLASERVIVRMLGEACPDIPIVSEETAPEGGFKPPAARFWCVDPLDGTKEFVAKNGEFCVCIGLIEDGVPVMGVVHGPVRRVTYAASGPGTAIRIADGGAPEPIAARRPPADGLVVIHSRSHENSRRLAEYFAGKPAPIVRRDVCGSALKFGIIAAGEADFYPRFGTTMEWDTAAGQAILEAAGGTVLDLEGNRLAYGKSDLKNSGFLAWGANPAW